jgi:hypothetical protein
MQARSNRQRLPRPLGMFRESSRRSFAGAAPRRVARGDSPHETSRADLPRRDPPADGTATAPRRCVYRVRWKDPVSGERLGEEFDTPEDVLDFRAHFRLAARRGALQELDIDSEPTPASDGTARLPHGSQK